MAQVSDLPVHDFVVPAMVWVVIAGYYVYQSTRRSKQRMVAGQVSADHLYYTNYFFYVSE
jgi:hypothetical protein